MTKRKTTRAASKPAGQAARETERGAEEPTPPRKGRPAVAGKRRSASVDVRLTEDERARLEAVAGHGRVSEWVRGVVLRELDRVEER